MKPITKAARAEGLKLYQKCRPEGGQRAILHMSGLGWTETEGGYIDYRPVCLCCTYFTSVPIDGYTEWDLDKICCTSNWCRDSLNATFKKHGIRDEYIETKLEEAGY